MRSMIFYRLLPAILFFSTIVLSAENDSKIESHDLLAHANKIFSEANDTQKPESISLYLKAASLYEKVAQKAGINNAKLYYNIGNCYLLADNIGMAIYNYKKSERIDSTDPLLQKNLAVARSKRLDRVEVEIERKVLSTIFFWHYDFSTKVRFYLALSFFALIMLLATIKVLTRTFGGYWPLTIVLGLMFLSMTASVVIETVDSKIHTEGVIIASELVARKGDSEKYEKAFNEPLHEGTEFELIEKRPGWIRVSLVDGSKVWLPEEGCRLL
ncbi:MAG: hypothetical protein ACIAQZ_02945 [Sedimentisphaeraceae bacterium JB056]